MRKRYTTPERSGFRTGRGLLPWVYALVMVWGAVLATSSALAGEGPAVDPVPLVITTAAGEHAFRVELALTDATRMTGLMHRAHLAPDAGMLFVWSENQLIRMWMKNTVIPLDMLFLDETGRVVHIEARVQPHDLTPRGPERPVRAVLELVAGTAERLGLAIGDTVHHPALPGGPG